MYIKGLSSFILYMGGYCKIDSVRLCSKIVMFRNHSMRPITYLLEDAFGIFILHN